MSADERTSDLALLKHGSLDDWRGLPSSLTVEEALAVFPPASEGEGRARLGRGEAWFRVADGGRLGQRFRVWYADNNVLLFDGERPELAETLDELRGRFGPPEASFDYHLGTTPIQGGEHVYPGQGLALFLAGDGSRLHRVALFPATTLDGYEQRHRLHLRQRRLPRNPM
jgi:hypothetical protein